MLLFMFVDMLRHNQLCPQQREQGKQKPKTNLLLIAQLPTNSKPPEYTVLYDIAAARHLPALYVEHHTLSITSYETSKKRALPPNFPPGLDSNTGIPFGPCASLPQGYNLF